VQGRHHEVTGDGGVGRDARGVGVADLADEQDVGSERSTDGSAVENVSRRGIDLHLLDAVERNSTGFSIETMLLVLELTSDSTA